MSENLNSDQNWQEIWFIGSGYELRVSGYVLIAKGGGWALLSVAPQLATCTIHIDFFGYGFADRILIRYSNTQILKHTK